MDRGITLLTLRYCELPTAEEAEEGKTHGSPIQPIVVIQGLKTLASTWRRGTQTTVPELRRQGVRGSNLDAAQGQERNGFRCPCTSLSQPT